MPASRSGGILVRGSARQSPAAIYPASLSNTQPTIEHPRTPFSSSLSNVYWSTKSSVSFGLPSCLGLYLGLSQLHGSSTGNQSHSRNVHLTNAHHPEPASSPTTTGFYGTNFYGAAFPSTGFYSTGITVLLSAMLPLGALYRAVSASASSILLLFIY